MLVFLMLFGKTPLDDVSNVITLLPSFLICFILCWHVGFVFSSLLYMNIWVIFYDMALDDEMFSGDMSYATKEVKVYLEN